MCKAVSHDLAIREVRLLEKSGGKSDYRAAAADRSDVADRTAPGDRTAGVHDA
jgi:hypothetical protein